MKKSLLTAIVLLTVGFNASFASPNQGSEQEGKMSDQKSTETKKQDALDRLNKDLSDIPQSMKDCIFNAPTIKQLESCHNSK